VIENVDQEQKIRRHGVACHATWKFPGALQGSGAPRAGEDRGKRKGWGTDMCKTLKKACRQRRSQIITGQLPDTN